MKLLSRGTNGETGYSALARHLQARRRVGSTKPDSSQGRLRFYLGCLIVVATSLATLGVVNGYALGSGWAVLLLGATAAISERQRVSLTSETQASISIIPILFAAVLFGPVSGMIVAALSNLGAFERPLIKWAVYTCSNSITGSLTGFSAVMAAGFASGQLAKVVAGTVAGALTAEVSEVSFAAVTKWMRGKRAVVSFRTLAPLAFASFLLYTPLVGLLAAAYLRISPLTLPLFLIPALAAQRLFGLYQKQRSLTEDLVRVNVRLERANLSFATALVATLDARDRYTAGHSAAVAIYARDIARRLGLPEEDQQLAHQCGLVHDIGKIGLPPGLLEKPGALTLGERRQMEKHSEIGERILAKVEDYAEIARIVRHHHERWDGQGYPDGVADYEIPLISRIISVADAYNAMTSDRPYRDAMPSRVARMRLAQGVESQFDTTIVAAFEAILAGADEEYRTGRRADFSLADQDIYSEPPDLEPEPEQEPEQEPEPVKQPIADVA
jgi:putative nucleotidyltransferase with HDIG domain